MKTIKELQTMNMIALNKLAHELNIQHSGKLDRVSIINRILEKQELKDEIEFTDRNDKPIVVDQLVQCRLGGTWYKGVIEKLKMIDEDQYATVLLNGQTKTKMFHIIDIDSNITLPIQTKKDLLNGILSKDPNIEISMNTPETLVEAKIVQETVFQPESPKVEPKEKKPKAPKKKKEKVEYPTMTNGRKKHRPMPHAGSRSEAILEMLRSGKKRMDIVRELGVVYSFVVTVQERYCD